MAEDIIEALADVEAAIQRVEQAVQEGPAILRFITWFLLGILAFSVLRDAWYSRLRYSLQYSVSRHNVQIEKKPHDCAFLAPPLGEKYCHYDRVVSTVRWARSTTGDPISSYDEGKTWTTFTPTADVTVPGYSTVEEVDVSWAKKDDD